LVIKTLDADWNPWYPDSFEILDQDQDPDSMNPDHQHGFYVLCYVIKSSPTPPQGDILD
jgi:hypothetical protein